VLVIVMLWVNYGMLLIFNVLQKLFQRLTLLFDDHYNAPQISDSKLNQKNINFAV
jgi:hypothetical protein